ncbi:MAG: class I SAM-dependent methyltransferase, partial [Eubacteriales bacterium]
MNDVSYENWVDYILKMMAHYGAPDEASILDAGCGTGSVAVLLRQFGMHVTGVDMSQDMLNVAEEKARQAGVDVAFVCQDLAELALHSPVNVVNASCDVVNYIAPQDLSAFFEAVNRNLLDDGIFLFDISSDYKLQEVLGNNIFYEDQDELTYIWQNRVENNRVNMDITLFKKKGEFFERSDEQHTQYIHSIKQIKTKLMLSGFDEIDVYSCFGFDAPKIDSERIQFCAKKG